MRKVTEDRRTRRTKNALEKALAELILKKDINKITIKDITDKADTNRSTFYTHYEDIYDLLHVLEDRLIDGISGSKTEYLIDAEAWDSTKDAIQYILDNRELFSAIVRSSQGPEFLGRITEQVGKRIMPSTIESPENRMIVSFYMNGAVAVLRDWLGGNTPPFSVAQMCSFLESIIRPGISTLMTQNLQNED